MDSRPLNGVFRIWDVEFTDWSGAGRVSGLEGGNSMFSDSDNELRWKHPGVGPETSTLYACSSRNSTSMRRQRKRRKNEKKDDRVYGV